jgi:hypothetical protein
MSKSRRTCTETLAAATVLDDCVASAVMTSQSFVLKRPIIKFSRLSFSNFRCLTLAANLYRSSKVEQFHLVDAQKAF